ncbi:hypothetical protein PQO03_04235 [Lentisphaera profundi]|jgi:hypothetical protein|uniref:LamG-like jellyroll fold domain-containing protein n=1 Tax=Lentisphaera profundi TaxID=1658616 RepID=A0ABY7VTV6_9BACT|nr:LamG-like jellyroll fold domain-containing protein [Lentisphaera profundi]WDE97162.1 hypothetical protein PQO03_04235 [Lentisphaera profundi]
MNVASKIISTLIVSQVSILAGQVAEWTFDKRKNTLADTSISQKHQAKMLGKAARFGFRGYDKSTKYAAKFEGREDSMILVDPHQDLQSKSFSCLVHTKTAVKRDGKYRAVIYSRRQAGFCLYQGPRGNWQIWIKGDNATWNKHIIAAVNEDQWMQFLISYNAKDINPENENQGRLLVWQNGELKVDTYSEYLPSMTKLSIGANSVGTANYKGLIDNIEIWNEAILTLKEQPKQLSPQITEKEIKLAKIRLAELNFDSDANITLSGDDAASCFIRDHSVFLHKGVDLEAKKQLSVSVSVNAGLIAKSSSIELLIPISSHMITRTK